MPLQPNSIPPTVAGLPRRNPFPFRPGFAMRPTPTVVTPMGALPSWVPAPMANPASIPQGVTALQPSELLRAATNGTQLALPAGQAPIAALPAAPTPSLGQPIALPGPEPLPRWNPVAPNVSSLPSGVADFQPTNALRGALNRLNYNPSNLVTLEPGAFKAMPTMASENLIAQQMGSAIGRSALPGTGLFGTGMGAELAAMKPTGLARFTPKGIGARGLAPMSGLGNAAAGMAASAVAGGLRDRILFGGDQVLDTDTVGGRVADAGTQGMVYGVPFGPAGVAVGGLGAAAGQAGVEAIASDLGQWIPSPLAALHSTLAERDAEGRSVTKAADTLYNETFGRVVGRTDQKDMIPEAVATAMNAAGKVYDAERDNIIATTNAENLTAIGREMGLSPQANNELAAAWDETSKQLRVMMERGMLTVEQPDPKDDKKTITVPVTEENFPYYLEAHFNQMVQSIPEIVTHEREAAQQQEAARADEAARMNRAIAYGATIRDIMGESGQMAALQNNPYTAGIAPLIMQGITARPMMALTAMAQEQSAANQTELQRQQNAALAQQQAYELAMIRAQAQQSAQQDLDGALAAP